MSPFAMLAEDFLEAKSELRADFHPGRVFAEPSRSDAELNTRLRKSRVDAAGEVDYRIELTKSLATIVEPLAATERLLTESLRSRRDQVQPMLDYVTHLGGKRLRPALLLLSAQAIGPISEEAIRLAVVVELVHTATLVHDDILDAASTRRHHTTMHCQWDVPRAILIGDWLFTQAYNLANLGQSTLPGRWIAAAAKAVCEGEILQGSAAGTQSLGEREYFQMLAGKTGALCAVSCGLGTWAAGGTLAQCEAMYDFGMKLGIGFQVHDDWLDIWGDPIRTGKPVGSDLRGGKWTLPVLRYLDTADEMQRARMLELLHTDMSDGAFDAIRNMLDASDSADFVRHKSVDLIDEAVCSLDTLAESDASAALRRLAVAAVRRVC